MTEWCPTGRVVHSGRIIHGDATAEHFEESVLDEAHGLVHGARRNGYGAPLDNHTATGRMFGAYLERKYGVELAVDADDVCWFNILQKASRDANTQARDNLVDVAGYAHNIELVRAERARREGSSTTSRKEGT